MQIFIHRGEKTEGPFTLETIRQALAQGSVNLMDFVSYGGGSQQVPLILLPGLSEGVQTSPVAQPPPPKPKLGCCGWIFVLGAAAFVGLMLLGLLGEFMGPDVKVTGTTGTITHKIIPTSNAKLSGFEIAKKVYVAATKLPELKRVVVNVEFVPALMTDKYGRDVKGPLTMGTLTVDDLAEVRRYTEAGAYMNRNGAIFTQQILRMDYVEYLGM